MRGAVALAVVALCGVVACSGDDDDDDADEPATESTVNGSTSTSTTPAVATLTLSATIRLDSQRVVFDYVLWNPGTDAVAVVDPATVVDQLAPAGDGAFTASFLRPEGDLAGGSPLPPLRGLAVAGGAEVPGSVGVTGQFEQLPSTVQLCVEVVPQPWTETGDGGAEFPHRQAGAAPETVCTEQLPLPGS